MKIRTWQKRRKTSIARHPALSDQTTVNTDTHLVVIDSLVESLFAELGQFDQVPPLLVHLVDTMLDLLGAKVSVGDQLLADLTQAQHVLVARRHLILVRLSGKHTTVSHTALIIIIFIYNREWCIQVNDITST